MTWHLGPGAAGILGAWVIIIYVHLVLIAQQGGGSAAPILGLGLDATQPRALAWPTCVPMYVDHRYAAVYGCELVACTLVVHEVANQNEQDN